MHTDKLTLTRRIQLKVDTADPEEKAAAYRKIAAWQGIVCRAANLITSHHYVQEQLTDFFYLTEGTRARLVNQEKDPNGLLNCSRGNTTYQVLSARFKGQIPTRILNTLNHTLVATLGKESEACRKGERSVRSYRRDQPIPIAAEDLERLRGEDGVFYFRLYRIPLKTYLGGRPSDKRRLLQEVVEGKRRLRAGTLKLEDGKLFLNVGFEAEPERHTLDPAVVAEAKLSFEHPVAVRIAGRSYTIGNREELLHRRLAVQAALKRATAAVTGNRGGKGRKRKMKNIERFRDALRNFMAHKMHVYSHRLIELCVRHGAATLLLSGTLTDEETAREENFLIRNWGAYDLKTKILYKAKKAGIEVIVES